MTSNLSIRSAAITTNNLFSITISSFSVGETGRIGTTGRREIGHGALAERALKAIMPPHADFPIRCELSVKL